eukprot:485451-Amphidinium_carterae.2
MDYPILTATTNCNTKGTRSRVPVAGADARDIKSPSATSRKPTLPSRNLLDRWQRCRVPRQHQPPGLVITWVKSRTSAAWK